VRRSFAMVTAGALVAALALPGATVASNRPVEYLALGDSLAFGWVPPEVGGNPTDPESMVGYPNYVADALSDGLTNAACPGETSGHFLDLAATDNGCGTFRFVFNFPLHTTYGGTQMAYADEFLADHAKTRLVTIDIGANDLKVLEDTCGTDAVCFFTQLPAVLTALGTNLDTIYRHLRVGDGYIHKLVALTIYSNDYRNTALTAAVVALNGVVAQRTLAWGGIVADGFDAFAAAALPYGGNPCAAGLLLVKSASPLTCDDHPSAAGHQLLAQTIVETLRAD
jgi:lysophospholipase L1-like esterase